MNKNKPSQIASQNHLHNVISSQTSPQNVYTFELPLVSFQQQREKFFLAFYNI